MRKNTLKLIIIITICTFSSIGIAWWPTSLGTHDTLTEDSLDYINSSLYPDIQRFADKLREGSRTEAHSPPDVAGSSPTSPHRWFPFLDHWWNFTSNPDKKCVMQLYQEYDFEEAYKRIGYMCHNTQDLSVPSHLRLNIHGTFWKISDSFEEYVISHHGYASGSTPWTFYDSLNRYWIYWMDDSMDDDNEDNGADYGLLPGIPDHNGDFSSDWGIDPCGFGSYGCGVYFLTVDPLPGKNEGLDAFLDYPKESIAHEQLYEAMSATRSLLINKSEALPPLIPNGTPYTAPSVTRTIFGPNLSVNVTFMALENRLKTVKVTILAGSTAIKDTSGKDWDGGDTATYDLSSNATSGHLPWESTITKTWSGQLKTGTLNDGQHTIKIKVKDGDGHDSQERTLSVKYDKTPPTGSVTISKI